MRRQGAQRIFLWRRGAMAVEYGLIVGGIAAIVAAGVLVLGKDIRSSLSGAGTALQGQGITDPDMTAPVVPDKPSPPDPIETANGSFESDQKAGGWSLGAVKGWQNTGSGGKIERWGTGFLGVTASDGSSFIELDATRHGVDHITTEMALDSGIAYTLHVDHAARGGAGAKDVFEITHNGDVIATIAPATIGTFTTSTVAVTGAQGPDVIGLREMPQQNDGLGVLIDNLRVTQP